MALTNIIAVTIIASIAWPVAILISAATPSTATKTFANGSTSFRHSGRPLMVNILRPYFALLTA